MLVLLTAAQSLALFKGLATSAGLIIAIGAQNAFVLSQGLRREHHWPVAGLCAVLDMLLIVAGVAGMGILISQSPFWMECARWGGVVFLLWYGARALKSALNPSAMVAKRQRSLSFQKAILTTLAVTLLNPHAYLDTVVLLGSIGGQYPVDERYWFAAGAISFSFIWFFTLVAGARFLQPLFEKPQAWQILDFTVCLMMWAIAVSLLWPSINNIL